MWKYVHHWTFCTLLVLIYNVNSKLLQTKGRSAQSQGVVVYTSPVTSNCPGQQGGREGYHWKRPWQEAWSIQKARHYIALLQQLPPIFPYIHGSLECSKHSQTPPCHSKSASQITLTSARVSKYFRKKKKCWHLKIFFAHLLLWNLFNMKIYHTKDFK